MTQHTLSFDLLVCLLVLKIILFRIYTGDESY